MEDNKIIDQSELANDVSSKIEYDFLDFFLIKPLDAIKVTKEFTKPVIENPAKKDENGVEAIDYDKVETEVKEVDSDFRKGVVLKVPTTYIAQLNNDKDNHLTKINVGDVIVFNERAGRYFDLLKDSRLIRLYDIVAIVK